MTKEVVPVHAERPATLKTNVLWLDPVEGDWNGVMRVMRHPVVAILFLFLLSVIWIANETPPNSDVPFLLRVAVYAFSPVFATGTVLAWIGLRYYFRRAGRDRVNLTLPVIAAVCFIVPSNEVLQRALIGQPYPPLLHILYMIIFYGVLALALTAVITTFLAPRLLNAATGDDPAPAGDVRLAGRTFALADIVMLEAQRNRVALVRLTGRDTLPGPLADRIAELPQGMGRLVHRSVWVSEAAVTGHRRGGRDIVILLAGGHSTIAAASRHAEVLPWLQTLDGKRAQDKDQAASPDTAA